MIPHVLQITEGVTHQRAALRIDPEEVVTVGDALELFRDDPAELVEAGWLLEEAVVAFREVGECLYAVDAEGELDELCLGLRVLLGHEPLVVDLPLLFERRPLPGGGEVMLADLTLDRRDCTYQRDWDAFHARKWRQERDLFEGFLLEAAREAFGVERAERAAARRSEADRGLLLRAAAERIYRAPFELYSRFVGRRRIIKDGAATLRNIVAGHGGACSEKAQAVKLVTDALELESAYVLSGPGTSGEVPEEALLEILDTFDIQYSKAVQSYWNHVAVLVRVEGQEVLVDASNGNLPFLWARGDELRALLDARGEDRVAVTHKYVVEKDELYYHRVDQLVPERLLFALELGWADPHIDVVQAVDDELGLLGGRDLWIGVVPFRDEEERETIESWYRRSWLEPGKVGGLAFARDLLELDDPLVRRLREREPEACRAAALGLPYFEARLEEANPGEGYRIEHVVAERIDEEDGDALGRGRQARSRSRRTAAAPEE